MQSEPLRVAFYGLAASELDLFTLIRRAGGISLALVVDQGPMGIARRLAEIAGVQASGDPWDLPKARLDWIVTGRLVRTPAAPLQRAEEGGARVLSVREAMRKLLEPEPAVPEITPVETGAPAVPEITPVETGAPAVPETAIAAVAEAESVAPPAAARSGFLSPTESDTPPDKVVGWALDGLMSSVHSLWGAALAKANGDTCLVERGIELASARPEVWSWLKTTVSSETGEEPPPGGGELAWAPLRSDARVIGAVILGRGEKGAPFTSSDRTWLEKVGERIASILSQTTRSGLRESARDETVAPAAVWAAPVLERAEWARGWIKGQFDARGCWIFAAMEGSPEPQLVDESWGAAPPPFLSETIREATEGVGPQVWLESGGDRAIVLQPLGPWGVKWTVVLEGVPWRGDGRATLARLKRAAATLARLLKST
jgi:hypothetical protein